MQALRSSARPFGPATTALRSSSGRATSVVVRVKPSQAADYRALSPEELMQGVASLKAEYTKLQYLKRTRGKVTNPETLQVRRGEGEGRGTMETPLLCRRWPLGSAAIRARHASRRRL